MPYTKQTWVNGPGGGTPVSAARLSQMETGIADAHAIVDADVLAAGEATIRRREYTSNAITSGNGVVRLTYFTARKTEDITKVRTVSGATAQVGATLSRVGVYSEDPATGNLTLIAAIANDTTLWAAASTEYLSSLTSTFSKQKGSRYALGHLVVGTTTAPTFPGRGSVSPAADARPPRLAGQVSGQTDLPASISAGSISQSGNHIYAELVP